MDTTTPRELDERLGCYVCTFYEAQGKGDARTTVYTVNGTEVVVGIGKGGRLVAHTKEHRPLKGTPEEFEFRQALLRWIEDNVPLERRVLPLLSFGPLHKASSAHSAEYRLYPNVVTVAADTAQAERLYDPIGDAKYRHPHLFANIFELQAHFEWPLRVADAYVHVAQEFVGYFYGKHVTSEQMRNIGTDERGDYDSSVKLTDSEWVEPFDIEDDCPMCQRMTDRSVEERVAGFQWELDKESQSRTAQNGGPRHADYDMTPEGRAEYHAAVDAHLAAHPQNWRPFPLIKLPHRLKRLLCIRWNHVVRDWLTEDPRYSYKDGHYYVIWVERIGGYDQRPTRSDSYGSSDMGYYAAAMAAYQGIAYTPPPPPPADEEIDERNIWLGGL